MATLVCSIGTANLSAISYEWQGKRYTTRFASVALAKLNPSLSRAKVLLLVTAEAKEKWREELTKEFAQAKIPEQSVIAVDIPLGRTNEEIRATFEAIAEHVGDGEEVYLDVTFSLRHLPFLYLAALTYLTAHRGVKVQGIYYGAYELKQEDVAPILEVTELFRLIRWHDALQAAIEDGNLRRLARSLKDDLATLFQSGGRDTALSKAKDQAARLAESVAKGLPLEIGEAAAHLLETVRQLSPTVSPEYLALSKLKESLGKLAYKEGASRDQLSESELQRQLDVAKWYLNQGDLPKTVLILREWLVNLTILRLQDASRWLELTQRDKAEAYLNGLSRRAELQLPLAAAPEVASLWSAIRDRRNRFAHVGMSQDSAETSVAQVRELLERCTKLLADSQAFTSREGRGPLLITALGLSPGVLTTALSRLNPPPARMIVITSEQARQHLQEAVNRSGVEVEPITRELADPHAGYQQADELLKDREVLDWLTSSSEVIVNLAGGTTVMQYVVDRLAREAQRMGMLVRRVVTVDRRTVDEQRQNPYELGELIELDVERARKGDDADTI